MRRTVLVPLAVVALFTAACGGDDGGATGATTGVEATTGTFGETGGTGATGAADCKDQTSKKVFSVELADFQIIPACLIVTGDQSSEVTNSGAVTHTFTILDTGVDVEIGSGETDRFEATGLDPGTYTLQCQIHTSMVAELRVE